MNTVEKQKIEKIINRDIEQRITAYSAQRSEQVRELVAKVEKKAPTEVQKLASEYRVHKAAMDAAEKKVEERGWRICSDGSLALRTRYEWGRNGSTTTYFAPEITEHQYETAERIEKLKQLGTNYALRLYAGTDAVPDIYGQFAKELEKLA